MMPWELLTDASIPLIVVEGEFKALALWRLSTESTMSPRFAVLGLQGVWNWRGKIGKETGPTGERRDVTGVITDFDRIAFKDRKTIIAFDSDARTNEQVRKARAALAHELRSRGSQSAFLEWDIAKGKGIDDHIVAVGADAVLAEISAGDYQDRRANLITNQSGEAKPILANVITALRTATEWNGVLAFNEFSLGTVALKPAPWGLVPGEWTDHEDRLTADWLQHRGSVCRSR